MKCSCGYDGRTVLECTCGARDLKDAKREARILRKGLHRLAYTVEQFIGELDAAYKLPPTPERGKLIGRLVHALEFEKDRAKHFDLGFRLKKPIKRPV